MFANYPHHTRRVKRNQIDNKNPYEHIVRIEPVALFDIQKACLGDLQLITRQLLMSLVLFNVGNSLRDMHLFGACSCDKHLLSFVSLAALIEVVVVGVLVAVFLNRDERFITQRRWILFN